MNFIFTNMWNNVSLLTILDITSKKDQLNSLYKCDQIKIERFGPYRGSKLEILTSLLNNEPCPDPNNLRHKKPKETGIQNNPNPNKVPQPKSKQSATWEAWAWTKQKPKMTPN